jgi:hypothetical protein
MMEAKSTQKVSEKTPHNITQDKRKKQEDKKKKTTKRTGVVNKERINCVV